MKLVILTPDKEVYQGEVSSVTLPGQDGKFQILKGHAPMVAALSSGAVVYQESNTTKTVAITSGFVEVIHNEITVLAQGLL